MQNKYVTMKNWSLYLILLAPIVGFGQSPNSQIKELWETVSKKEQEYEVKSISPEIKQILDLSRKTKDYPSVLKALFYQARIDITTKDDADFNINEVFAEFNKERKNASGLYVGVIDMYLGKLYDLYKNANLYKLSSRTELEAGDAKDIRFMTSGQLQSLINTSYNEAIKIAEKHPNVLVKEWKDLFSYDTNSSIDFTNYTLYDAFRLDYANALLSGNNRFFSEEELDARREKAYQLINAVKEDVAKRNNVDLKVYTALFELEIRSDWSNSNKYEKYNELIKEYPLNLSIAHSYAQFLYRQFNQTDENDPLKVSGAEVLNYLEKVEKTFHSKVEASELKFASDLRKLITNPSFDVNTSEYIGVGEIAPLYVGYTNLDKVYVQVVKIDSPSPSFNFKYDIHEKEGYEYVATDEKVVDSYVLPVSKYEDYKRHTTRVALRPLEMGRYAIMVSSAPFDRLEKDKDVVSYVTVNVSDNVIVVGNKKLRAYNRITGKPLTNQRIRVTNGDKASTNKNFWETVIITDDKGEHEIGFDMKSSTRFYSIEKEDIFYSKYYYKDNNREIDNKQVEAKLFIDRGIYRPGQTVYFKGIFTEVKGLDEYLLTDKNFTVELYDANRKLVSSQQYVSNEFGSVQGAFVLPLSGGLGNFFIRVKDVNGYKYFSVEEYKRPKFEVIFDKVTGSYQLGENVVVNGEAVSFAGVQIDQAKVTYTVSRIATYPFLPWYRSFSRPYQNPELIAKGETITNQEGKFTIDFEAIPATNKIDKNDPRTYRYVIEATVTDINGETHSQTTNVVVGDRGVMLNLNVKANVKSTELSSIDISTTNLNGEKIDAKGELSVYELNAPYPKRLLNNAARQTVEKEYYSYDEFVKLFPYLPYGKELDLSTWVEGKEVFKASFNTADSNEISWKGASSLKSGAYVLKGFVFDKDGEKVSVEQLIKVTNENEKNIKVYDLVNVVSSNKVYKKGDTATYLIQSAEEDTYLMISVLSKGKTIEEKKLKIGKRPYKYEVSVKGQDNIDIYFTAVKHNFYQEVKESILVDNKLEQLTISVNSFRDKLTPGEKETWSLTISGEQKDKVLAEVLAGMYDASLDQFASNSFEDSFVKRRRYYNNSLDFNFYNVFDRTSYPQEILGNYIDFQNIYFNTPLTLDTFGLQFSFYKGDRSFGHISIGSKSASLNSPVVIEENNAVSEDALSPSAAGKVAVQGISSQDNESSTLYVVDGVIKETYDMNSSDILEVTILKGGEATALYGNRGANGVVLITTKAGALANLTEVQSRTNLNETAFFYPQITTDEEGNVKFEFTAPEALTQWKFMAFAHSKDLGSGYIEKTIVTQKDLMVIPNMPRFLRQGDEVVISNKTSNLSKGDIKGTVALLFFDAFTMEPIDALFSNTDNIKSFEIKKGESVSTTWNVKVPDNVQAVVYRVVAKAGEFSDGEESALAVLSNRMMVTESMPMYIKEGQKKKFTFDKYLQQQSASSDNFKLTFEMTTNPMWNAVFALPTLRENTNSSNSISIFSKFYANVVSTSLINSNPRIKRVFEDWNSRDQLVSRLEQNEELKSILIDETPWVRQAEREDEQMKRIALLFDLNKMQLEQKETFNKLLEMQNNDGGFSWFNGGSSELHTTQSIIKGLGILKKMGMFNTELVGEYKEFLAKAIQFVDEQQFATYQSTLKNKKNITIAPINLNYLYARSFFNDEFKIKEQYAPMMNYYLGNLESATIEGDLYSKAMRVLVAKRYGQDKVANKILKSISETAVESDEMGMYWKENTAGWYWYNSPIEVQVLIMEAYSEIKGNDNKAIDEMKVWLLKNKQTVAWNSDKATTAAIYALLNLGKSWIDSEKGLSVAIGGEYLDIAKDAQMGSGYVKESWSKGEMNPLMGTVEIEKTSPGIAYGAMYWQYFEDLDKITTAKTGVQFNKELFLKVATDKGEVLRKITTDTPIKVGDKVTVRLEIITDRDMDYVHIKDMRASGFEPINVFSRYNRKGEFNYYEETRDAATNFFVSRLKKGSYVFEYDLRANTAGYFSNGITTLQNMYAPEMNAHSEGIKVEIKN